MSHEELIKNLIDDGYLRTPQIIKAFEKIDRAKFVRENDLPEAYINAPLSIGFGQTISQPLTVAFMIELLDPQPGEKILDVGAGSGWQSAILAHIVGEKGKIFSIETIPQLAEFGKKNVEKYEFISNGRIEFICDDGSLGFSKFAPFDKIIAAAAASGSIPDAWKEQLKIGGRIVAPIDSEIDLFIKKAEGKFEEKHFYGFAFVPLITGKNDGAKR